VLILLDDTNEIVPRPESTIILLVSLPLTYKLVFVVLVAPISPTVTKASPAVSPPRLKDIPFECVIILF
jgi:hypothetical protein